METLIIRVDASPQIGMGHLMRCLALAQAWKDAGGRVMFITVYEGDDSLQRLREEGFGIYLLGYAYPNPADWNVTKEFLFGHSNAWVVLDGYHFDESYQRWIKESGHRLLAIDDLADLKHYYADIVLNQNLTAEQLHYSCEPYTQLLLGTCYALLRREFLGWKSWKREVSETAQRVLVTLGGGDPENHTLKVIEALQKVDVANLEAKVVIGVSNPHADILGEAVKKSHIAIDLIRNAADMPQLMAWADVAVSAGGSTVWELAFMGLPSIILVWADNQRDVAKELDTAGVVLNLGWCADVTSADIAEALLLLLKGKNLRVGMALQGQELVDGGGAERVVNFMREQS